jgi:hypothetical protein
MPQNSQSDPVLESESAASIRTLDYVHSTKSTSVELSDDPNRPAVNIDTTSNHSKATIKPFAEKTSYTSDGAQYIRVIGNRSDDSLGISSGELESDLRSPMLSQSDPLYAHNSHDTIAVQKNNADTLQVDR